MRTRPGKIRMTRRGRETKRWIPKSTNSYATKPQQENTDTSGCRLVDQQRQRRLGGGCVRKGRRIHTYYTQRERDESSARAQDTAKQRRPFLRRKKRAYYCSCLLSHFRVGTTHHMHARTLAIRPPDYGRHARYTLSYAHLLPTSPASSVCGRGTRAAAEPSLHTPVGPGSSRAAPTACCASGTRGRGGS